MQNIRGTSFVAASLLAALCLPVWGGEVSAPGIPNFHQVNDHVYRGAQPRHEGWNSLAKLGVKTVIDLRESSEQERREVEAAGMRYVGMPLSGIAAPPPDKIARLLALLTDSPDPVFVHCRRGADRTGTLIACYRIQHDGWKNERALAEAKAYGMAGFEITMQRFVLGFQPPIPATIQAAAAPSTTTLK